MPTSLRNACPPARTELGTLAGSRPGGDARSVPQLLVFSNPSDPSREDEYNDWYDKEHLPRLVTVAGVIRARRYTAVSGNPRYLTAYELTDRNAFESPEGLQARKTPWTAKMRGLFFNTRRRMCRLITRTRSG